ncbi:MAG: CPBP family intramembrane glutamic endopeptidase [Rhodospirillales bacterium]
MSLIGPGNGARSTALSATAWAAIALAFLPVVVKRSVVLGEPGVLYWLVWDYTGRFVSLAGVILAYVAGIMGPPPARAPLLKSIAVFVLGLLAVWLMLRCVTPVLGKWLPYFQYFTHPHIRDRNLLLFDMVVGAFLVALNEELVFRRLLFSLLERFDLRGLTIILSSSAAFALIHLTSGLASLVGSFLAGLIFASAFYATGRLSISIALHYIGDFVAFGLYALQRGALAPAISS